MDSCPFSLDSLEEFKLGKTLHEGEPIPGRARLHPNFSTAILLWLPTYLFPSLMCCFPFFAFCFSLEDSKGGVLHCSFDLVGCQGTMTSSHINMFRVRAKCRAREGLHQCRAG